ncbi:MAG: YeeE/YedE family protein [Anaerolineales bacterium]|uniref:YeeE/YedE thiosulfate transporter family protein n=1 Tax=Candidatus Villigracilis vicinus TaxID=3140679 RepID=UPI003137293C|nr:YeeE/YedE family protein [Anaerolineales bacterium]
MNFILNYIRKETWSPYVAGVLLGLVGIAAVWISDSLLGASGAFENLAGLLGQAVAPQVFDNMYFNFIMPPGITVGVILLVGVFFGGMIGAATSGTLKWGKKTLSILMINGSASLAHRPGSAGYWLLLARSFWNMRRVSLAAAQADWRSRAVCCSLRLLSCSLPECLPLAL